MLVPFPRSASTNVSEGGLIALTKDDKFIGYGEIFTVLEDVVLVKVDSRASKKFTELYGEDIPFDVQIM